MDPQFRTSTPVDQGPPGNRGNLLSTHPATWLLIVTVGLGIALRAWQYFSNPSLWLDELAVANNIEGRGLWDLVTGPLDYGQVAPRGYLLIQGILAGFFGASEMVLRLYSFVAGSAALVTSALLAKAVLGRSRAWIPVAMLAVSSPFILQSAQVKPYAGDLLFTSYFLLVAVQTARRGSLLSLRWPATFGAVAPWLSFPALYAMGALGIMLLRAARRAGTPLVRSGLLPIFGVWAASAAGASATALVLTPDATSEFMKNFWSDGFPQWPLQGPGDVLWPFTTLVGVLREFNDLRGTRVLALIAVAGMGHVALRRNEKAYPLVVALLAAGTAAALALYPLQGRLAQWATPLVAILVVIGAHQLLEATVSRINGRAPALLLPLLVLGSAVGLMRDPPPYPLQHSRPVLQHLDSQAEVGDAVYVYFGGWQAWRYYAPRTGVDRLRIVSGGCSRSDRSYPLRELQELDGADRLWLFFSHVEPQLRMRGLLTAFLEESGAVLLHEMTDPLNDAGSTTASSVQLYDLAGVTLTGPGGLSAMRTALAKAPAPVPDCLLTFLPETLIDG